MADETPKKTTTEHELFLLVDANGECEVGTDLDAVIEAHNESYTTVHPTQVYRVTLTVPLPVEVHLTGRVEPAAVGAVRLHIGSADAQEA